MTSINPLYIGKARATGGRNGEARADEDRFVLALSTPRELGGPGGAGTNPEQMFAAGYAACFIGALKFVGQRDGVMVPAETAIDAAVGIGPIEGGFGINAALTISLPGLDKAVAERLIAEAHKVCPYSNATRGNIDVTLTLAA